MRKHAELSNYFIGANWITPTIIEYTETRLHAVELSTGIAPLTRGEVYGVTVKLLSDGSDTKLSAMFDSLPKALNYIKEEL